MKEKLWGREFTIFCLLNFISFMMHHMLTTTMPSYLLHLGGDEVIAGLSTTVVSFSALIARPLGGWVLDHKGRKRITILATAVMACALWSYNFLSSISMILAMRLVQGFSWGISDTAIATNAADVIPQSRFAEGIGIYGGSCSLALALAPAIGLFIIDYFDYPHLFLAISIAVVVALFLMSQVRYRQLPRTKVAAPFRLIDLIDRKAVKPCIVSVLYNIPYAVFLTFVAVYSEQKGISAGSFFTIMAVTVTIFRTLIGRSADRYKPERLLYFSMPPLFLCPILLVFAQTQWLFWASAVCFGLGLGMGLPCIQTIVVKRASPEGRGAATSTYFISFDIGMAIGGVLGGWLAKLLSMDAMFLAMTVPILAAAIYYYFVCDRPGEHA